MNLGRASAYSSGSGHLSLFHSSRQHLCWMSIRSHAFLRHRTIQTILEESTVNILAFSDGSVPDWRRHPCFLSKRHESVSINNESTPSRTHLYMHAHLPTCASTIFLISCLTQTGILWIKLTTNISILILKMKNLSVPLKNFSKQGYLLSEGEDRQLDTENHTFTE